MKKHLVKFLLLFALGLSGCSNLTQTKTVRESVEDFYQAYYDENLDEMRKFISYTMETPIIDSFRVYEGINIDLDISNDFTYEIESVVASDNVAYVNVKFICHDLSKLMMDDLDNGYNYSQYDIRELSGLVKAFEHYKVLMKNNENAKLEFTKQLKMIKTNNKWYFDTKESDLIAPYCVIAE